MQPNSRNPSGATPIRRKFNIVRHHHIPDNYTHCPSASFAARIFALVIDGVVVSVLSEVVVIVLTLLVTSDTAVDQIKGLVPLISSWAYFSIAHSRWGFTMGKRLMHLKVIDERTGGLMRLRQSVYREVIGKMVSSAILLLGFLMPLFSKRGLALHDRMASTRVVVDTGDTETAL